VEKVSNEEVRNVYRSPNIIRVIKYRSWIGHVSRMEESRSAFRILTGNPIAKRSLGRPRCSWEERIIIGIKVIGIQEICFGSE
jgi:hypothetical protein